jgi:sarcosine oxidase subunit beta
MEENLQYFELQRQMGWEVEKWEVSDLRKKAPFLDKTEDLGGAYFGVNDGLINPNTLKLHYREEALRLGVRFMDHTALVGAHEIVQAQNANGERILDEYLKSGESSYLRNSDTGLVRFELQVPHGGAIVNAAGPWAAQVAKALGYQRPTFALRRQIFLFESRTLDLSSYGMVVDTSGVYFHPEASFILGGVSNRDEKPGFSFETSGEEFFQERIWEPLFHRGSGFEELKLRTHWAGLYEMSPDESGIVGSVKPGVYEAHSFSGHGVMQSYAVGERLAEEILGSGPGIPELKGDRFERGALIQESAVI